MSPSNRIAASSRRLQRSLPLLGSLQPHATSSCTYLPAFILGTQQLPSSHYYSLQSRRRADPSPTRLPDRIPPITCHVWFLRTTAYDDQPLPPHSIPPTCSFAKKAPTSAQVDPTSQTQEAKTPHGPEAHVQRAPPLLSDVVCLFKYPGSLGQIWRPYVDRFATRTTKTPDPRIDNHLLNQPVPQ